MFYSTFNIFLTFDKHMGTCYRALGFEPKKEVS